MMMPTDIILKMLSLVVKSSNCRNRNTVLWIQLSHWAFFFLTSRNHRSLEHKVADLNIWFWCLLLWFFFSTMEPQQSNTLWQTLTQHHPWYSLTNDHHTCTLLEEQTCCIRNTGCLWKKKWLSWTWYHSGSSSCQKICQCSGPKTERGWWPSRLFSRTEKETREWKT